MIARGYYFVECLEPIHYLLVLGLVTQKHGKLLQPTFLLRPPIRFPTWYYYNIFVFSSP